MAEPSQLTVRRDFARPSAEEIAPFQKAPTGWVVDAQGRRGALPHWIKPLSCQTRFVGAALTVRTRPADNLAPYAALKFAKPGDLLLGDIDGVVVVPRANVRAVGAELAAIADKEARMEQVVKVGTTTPAWLDDILKSDRVRYID